MITCLRANNPGPMTLTGTNTWLLPAVEGGVVVVDPGPLLDDHLAAIVAAGRVDLILLTHHHHDHADLAPRLSEITGAPVRAADPALCTGAALLRDGEELPCGLVVVASPGHTDDSICFLDPRARALLTGDTVLGYGSSVILYGDGSVSASLSSLDKLATLVTRHDVDRLLPGHGPEVDDPGVRLRHDLAHRHDRLAQVSDALDAGATGVIAVTDAVHVGLDPALVPAARSSIAAHLAHLGALDPSDPWLERETR